MKHIINNKINKGKRSLLCIMHYALCISMLFASCSDMLESDSSRQLFDPALDQKTDSVFYAYGVMQAMQQLADQYYRSICATWLRSRPMPPTSTTACTFITRSSTTVTTIWPIATLRWPLVPATLSATSMLPLPLSVHGPICSWPVSMAPRLTSPSPLPPSHRSMPTPR